MNKKDKTMLIIIISIIVLLLGLVIYSFLVNKKSNMLINKDRSELEVMVKDVYLNKKTTKKELTKYFNLESVPNIIIGKDSYLTYKLPTELSKKHNLESYEKERKKYGDIVINKYLDNFDYKDVKNKDYIEIKIKAYDMGTYLSDIELIKEKLIDLSIDNSNLKPEEKYNNIDSITMTIYIYKAETIAMKVLNNYLDEYKVIDLNYNYKLDNNRKQENSNLYNLLFNTNNKSSTEDRINSIIDKAIKEGKINKDAPLSL